MVDAVDEMDRGEALRRALLRPVADPAEMEAVADRDQRHTLLGGARHAELHGLEADHLAVAAIALDHQDRAAIAHQLGMPVGPQAAVAQAT